MGRYLVFDEIASGGTATVHFGRLEGASGFARVVALKRLHPHVAKDAQAAAMLRDEAWLSSRVRHPNAVAVLDVVEEAGELVLVMEYVEGTTLAALLGRLEARGAPMPLSIVGAIIAATLAALEAAHVATAEDGTPLGLIHRDVSPQNVLIGLDGGVRLADFGVAKARGRLQTTQEGELKGKFAYMAPEQAMGKPLTRTTDLYAAGAVLWECVAGRRLHPGDEPSAVLTSILYGDLPSLRELRAGLPADVETLAKRALAKDPLDRFESAAAMREAVEPTLGCASARDVAIFVAELLGDEVPRLRAMRERIERAICIDVAPLARAGSLPPARGVVRAPPGDAPSETTVRVSSPAQTRRPRSSLRLVVIGLLVALFVGASSVVLASRRTRPVAADPPKSSPAPLACVAAAPPSSAPEPLPSPASAPPKASVPASEARPPRRAVGRPVKPPPSGTAPAPSDSLPAGLVGIPSDRE